ncbi:RDD family protein [Salegentibacter chungangensis]|uniref:RDD family protein n=2 Tax=Salegentibacter chungangensis TaxID=1335724 RepID=A0ABW3NUU7_9FLAO
MLLDHFIMTFSIVFPTLIIGGIGFIINRNASESNLSSEFGIFMGIVMLIMFSVYLNKDAIKGKSPGKRILGFVIVDNKTGKIATPVKALIRNITLVIWPIEVLVSIFSTQRRIGDYIAGTKVVSGNIEQEVKINKPQILLSLLLGTLILAGIFILQFLIIGVNFLNW